MADFLRKFTLFRNAAEADVNAADLRSKLVLLYFSGHWCPPCRRFTPLLKDFYEKVRNDMEVVFVSRDYTENDMHKYLKEMHGPWMYVKFSEIKEVNQKFKVYGIPTLTLIKQNGDMVDKDVMADVVEAKDPAEVIKKWRAMCEK